MKIITKLSKQDYLDYNRFLLGRVQKEHAKQKTMWVKNLLVWLVLVVVFYFVLQLPAIKMMRIGFTLIIVTATPFVILIGAFLYNQNKLINQAVPFADGLILGEKTIEFKEDGIYEKSPLAKTFYDWKAVDSLEENSGTLYIFVDRVLALIVPIGSKGDNIEIIRAFVSKKLAEKVG